MCVKDLVLCVSFLSVSAVVTSCSTALVAVPGQPVVIAHRGGASLAPENSLLAIERAISLGCDAVEVDVRLSSDGFPVVIHDATLERTTEGCGRVQDNSLSELVSLRLLSVDDTVSDERLPSLESLLEFVDGRCAVLIDVKCSSPGIEQAVIDVVEHCGAEGWVAVQSFSDRVLERFHLLGAPFPLEKLFVFKLPFLPFIYDGGISFFSFDRYSHVSSFNINRCFLRPGLLKKIRRAGKKVKVWTLGEGESVFRYPVDAVITDCPQLW